MARTKSAFFFAAVSVSFFENNCVQKATLFSYAAEAPKAKVPFSIPMRHSELEFEQSELKFRSDDIGEVEVEDDTFGEEKKTPFLPYEEEAEKCSVQDGSNSQCMKEIAEEDNAKNWKMGDGNRDDTLGSIEENSDNNELDFKDSETLSDKDYNMIIGSTLINPYANRTQSFIDAEAMNSNEVKDRCLQIIKEKDFTRDALDNLIRKYELFLHTYQGQGGYAEDLLDTVEERLSFCKEHYRNEYLNYAILKTTTVELEQTCFWGIFKEYVDGQRDSTFVRSDFLGREFYC